MSRAVLVLAFAAAAVTCSSSPSPAAAEIPTTCPAWHSSATPPRIIRVRISDRQIVRVPFALYVARVVSSEWNTVRPQLRFAGAVAVKQYAWVKAMRPRRSSAGCFDVWGNTRDQIYRAKTPPLYVWTAVIATWSWRVLDHGRLISTGYRTGRPHSCAGDVDGFHLFARSASRCAALGWGPRRILAAYYRGRVVR